MRRIAVLAVTFAYGFSFVAACLAACLLPAAPAGHACCATEDGIRPLATDCCSITPGITHSAPAGAAAPRPAALVAATGAAPKPAAIVLRVAVSTSPPLVLRV